ncbi:MAG: glycosyltransferase [Nitrosopumilaceae archaeon]
MEENIRKYVHKPTLRHFHGEELRKLWKHYDDYGLVSTPDLLDYAPNCEWLPSPVDIDFIMKHKVKKDYEDNRKVRVAHYPYYLKSTTRKEDYYSSALKDLEDKDLIEVVKIIDLPYATALKTVSSCDIAIGKMIPDIGYYGRFELEAMVMGIPTISYVRQDLYERYEPGVFCCDINNFAEKLLELVEDSQLRKTYGERGYNYTRKYHDVKKVTDQLLTVYSKFI